MLGVTWLCDLHIEAYVILLLVQKPRKLFSVHLPCREAVKYLERSFLAIDYFREIG